MPHQRTAYRYFQLLIQSSIAAFRSSRWTAGPGSVWRSIDAEGTTRSRNTAAVEDVAHLLVRCLRAEGAGLGSLRG